MVVEHFQALQEPPVSGANKLKVNATELDQVFGVMAPDRAIGKTGMLLLVRSRTVQSLFTPEAVHSLWFTNQP